MNVVPLHTEPPAREGRVRESFFALFGAPLAWFVQLCAGYSLASEPCYPGSERRLTLPPHLGWTRSAMLAVMLAACLVSLFALARSLSNYRRSAGEMQRSPAEIIRPGADRTCFLALWGIIFGAGFAVASAMTLAAHLLLPRCAG